MYIKDILYGIKYECDAEVGEIDIDNVTSDKNKIGARTLFVLVKGINFDTDTIIDYIIARRPRAIICDTDRALRCEIPVIRVPDARRTLSFACSNFFKIDYRSVRFIAVTGTNGKTTITNVIKKLLSEHNY